MIGHAASPARSASRPGVQPGVRLRRIGRHVLLYAGAFLLTFYCVIPLVWMFITALKPPNEVITWPPQILPREPTFRNFRLLF